MFQLVHDQPRSGAWIPKLKDDQEAAGAELAVLVSSAMPRDTREPFLREGDVWVARFEVARPLAEALRATLLEMHKLCVAQQVRTSPNQQRPECSPQFAQRVRSMVESVELMKRDLDAEKAAMMRIWAKREKQLQRMETGMLNVVGDLQGIGQGAVGQLDSIAVLPVLGVTTATTKPTK